MAANVESMVSGSGLVPWHGLGKVVEGLLTAADALTLAGLDWTVSKEKIKTEGGIEVPNAFAVKRSNVAGSAGILGVVGNQYTPLQNKEAFSMFDSIIQDHGGMTYDTAGVLGHGERVWMTVKVAGDIAIKGPDGRPSEDTMQRYILMANSHDGSSPVMLAVSTIRPVCSNTIAAALMEAKKLFRIRHTKSMGDKVSDAREALGIINKSYAELEEKMNALVKVKMTDKGFEKYIAGLGFDTEADKGKGKSTVDTLTALFGGEGKGSNLPTAKGTAFGGLQAIMQFADWERATRLTKAGSFGSEEEARFASAQLGSGQVLKAKALENALALAA